MPRIRTIKPEFWEDEKIGALSHGARLLFLCCLNLSDDEGLLRWNAFYLASNAFTYDEIKIETIEKWMKELVDNELIYVYQAGKLKQKIGFVINFKKHQKVERPQPSKFPLPDYTRSGSPNDSPNGSPNDSPNGSPNDSPNGSPNDSPNDSPNGSPNDSPNGSPLEKEREKEREEKKEPSKEGKKEKAADATFHAHPPNPDYEKFKDWLERNAPYCYKNMRIPTENEFMRLKEKYSGLEISQIIEQIENRKDLRKKYATLYRTVLNWAKNEYEK